MSRNPEYIYYDPSLENMACIPDWQTVVEKQQVIAPRQLKDILVEAKEQLISTPGPHQITRMDLVPSWLDGWIAMCENMKDLFKDSLVSSENIFRFQDVSTVLKQRKEYASGLLLGAGWEGTPAHKGLFLEFYRRIGLPIVGFEQDAYHEMFKERGASCLPLSVRLSMWQYFILQENMSRMILTVIPPPQIGEDLNTHYQDIHNQSGADFHFAAANDPYLYKKIHRGYTHPEGEDYHILSAVHAASTSRRAQRLFSGEMEKHVQKLFPDETEEWYNNSHTDDFSGDLLDWISTIILLNRDALELSKK